MSPSTTPTALIGAASRFQSRENRAFGEHRKSVEDGR
jgi:hypothetical protein